MSYINEIKKSNNTYDIQDKRIVEVTAEDVGKVLAAKADGTFELVAGGGTKLYLHKCNTANFGVTFISTSNVDFSTSDIASAYDSILMSKPYSNGPSSVTPQYYLFKGFLRTSNTAIEYYNFTDGTTSTAVITSDTITPL